MGILSDVRARMIENAMKNRILRKGHLAVRDLRRDGKATEADVLQTMLSTRDGEAEFVLLMLNGFEESHAGAAFGDGAILQMLLTWLTTGGGLEMILTIIKLFMGLATDGGVPVSDVLLAQEPSVDAVAYEQQ